MKRSILLALLTLALNGQTADSVSTIQSTTAHAGNDMVWCQATPHAKDPLTGWPSLHVECSVKGSPGPAQIGDWRLIPDNTQAIKTGIVVGSNNVTWQITPGAPPTYQLWANGTTDGPQFFAQQ